MHNQHRMYRVFYVINQLKTEPAKSTNSLAKALGITVRSVYRYFNLLEEIGFKVQKDERGKFYIQIPENLEKETFNIY